MSVQIPLSQRTQLPPSRVGAVKPPFDLADQSGQRAFGQSLAKFSGDTFNRLEQTRVANEEAQFQGFVNTSMKEYDVFVAGNPGASFKDLEKERDKMLAQIRKAGNSATMPRAQQNNARWYTQNLNSIRLQTQTSMESIRAKQELRAADEITEGYINSFDRESLISFTNQQVQSGLLEENFAKARLANQLDVIKAESKVAVQNVSQIGFDAWQATVTEADPDGDLNAALDAIEFIEGLTGDQKQNAESTAKTRINNRRAEDKLQAEQNEVESVEQIKGKLNKGEFDGMTVFINTLPLSETEKNNQIKTANSYIASVNNANTKSNFVTSDNTNIKIDRLIRSVRSGEVSYDDAIDEYQKFSKDVKASEGRTNLDNISTASNQSQSADDRRKNSKYTTRNRQLRDSIERQTSLLLEPDEIDEVLVDLANKAELELGDKFDGIDYEDEELTAEVDRLMRKYTLSEAQMTRAVTARQLRLAESFEDQQKAITESIRKLNEEGDREGAKRIMEEAISLGFDLTAEGKARPTQKKAKESGIKRILNRLIGRD